MSSRAENGAEMFSQGQLEAWASKIKGCKGFHGEETLKLVRKITRNSQYDALKDQMEEGGGRSYLMPNASWETVPGVDIEVGRGLIQDVLIIAGIMVGSRHLNHGLSKKELEFMFSHHCVEITVNATRANHMREKDGLRVLKHYVEVMERNLNEATG